MSITFTADDLEAVARAIRVMLSPFDHPHVDHWRSAVNNCLKRLLHADSAGFLLPVSDGLMMYSEEHDPAELAAYPDVVAPDTADGTPMWQQMIRCEVGTLASIYGSSLDRYLTSAYYNEYAGANGAHDTLAAAFSLGGMDARSMASVHLWHERPQGRLFGDREVALLRLLFPAFRAGVEAQLRWGGQRADLIQMLDGLGRSAMVVDRAGRLLHSTPAMQDLLGAELGDPLLYDEVLAAARALCAASAGAPGTGGGETGPVAREVRTRIARYRVMGCLHGRAVADPAGVVIVGVERLTPNRRCPEELAAAYSITTAEARVAYLLADGRSNEEIARMLFISPHTARRHTERVLRKMGIRSRSEVGARTYY